MTLISSPWVLYGVSVLILVLAFIVEMYQYFKRRKKFVTDLEKAKKQRIAIENHIDLWNKVMEMFCSVTIPKIDTPEWLALNKKCVEVDYDYEASGMERRSVNGFFLNSSYKQEKAQLLTIEIYTLRWREILEMIRNMNFPQKGTLEWEYLLFHCSCEDMCYLKYIKEKGELENTFRRMTE